MVGIDAGYTRGETIVNGKLGEPLQAVAHPTPLTAMSTGI
jgi:hypothetical protein